MASGRAQMRKESAVCKGVYTEFDHALVPTEIRQIGLVLFWDEKGTWQVVGMEDWEVSAYWCIRCHS